MAETCSCSVTLSNTGSLNCKPLQDVGIKDIIVPMVDSTGVANKIDLSTATFSQAEIDALINQTDDSKRWYPLPDYENGVNERAESDYETPSSGTKYKIKDGVRNEKQEMFNQTPEYVGRLRSIACVRVGKYRIDKSGNLIGDRSEAGYLKPIEMQKGTFDAQYMFPSDSTVPKVVTSYDWASSVLDSHVGMVLASEIAADLINANGLVDTYSDASTGASQTGFVQNLYTSVGSVLNPIVVEGLVSADFTVRNITDSADATTLVSVESPAGTYTYTFDSIAISKVLKVIVTKDGYDSTASELITTTTV